MSDEALLLLLCAARRYRDATILAPVKEMPPLAVQASEGGVENPSKQIGVPGVIVQHARDRRTHDDSGGDLWP